MATIAIGAGLGLAAGILSGLFGIGGGLIMVPALVMLGLTQRGAAGTSLAVILVPVGVFGVIEYARRHEIHWRYAIGLAIGLTIGAYFGARFAGHISNKNLQRGFGVLLIVSSIRFLFFAR